MVTLTNIRLGLLVLSWTVVVLRFPAIRSREQRPAWFILLMLAIAIPLPVSAASTVDQFFGIPRLDRLVGILAALAVMAGLLDFAVKMSSDWKVRPAPWHRVRFAYAGLTAAAMTASFTVASVLGTATSDKFLPAPRTFNAVTVFWIAWIVFGVVTNAWAAVLFWKQVPRTTLASIRIAVLLLACATTVSPIWFLTRIASLLSSATVFLNAVSVVSTIYFVLVAVGCSIAAIQPVIKAGRDWASCHRLYPLWRDLALAAPDIAFMTRPGPAADFFHFRHNALRLNRRMVEIRDGFLAMDKWLWPADLEKVPPARPAPDVTEDRLAATTTAYLLKVAFQAYAADRERSASPPGLLGQGGGTDAESELRWQLAVAAAWTGIVGKGVDHIGATTITDSMAPDPATSGGPPAPEVRR
jgi:hypothetical protein